MSRIGAIVKRMYGPQLRRAEAEEKGDQWQWRIRKVREIASNRKVLTAAVAVLSVLVILFILVESVFQYNLLCSWQVVTDARRADVNRELQRRANLIPNLVLAVEKYAVHEQLVFRHVSDAREAMKFVNGAGMGLGETMGIDFSKALSSLVALAEQYPLLNAAQSIQDLMKMAAETEDRIADAKKEYNRVTEIYNQYCTVFPGNMFAMAYGYRPVGYLDTEERLAVPHIQVSMNRERVEKRPGISADVLLAALQALSGESMNVPEHIDIAETNAVQGGVIIQELLREELTQQNTPAPSVKMKEPEKEGE